MAIKQKSNRSTNGRHSSRCGLVGKRGRAGLSLLEMAACFMPLCASILQQGHADSTFINDRYALAVWAVKLDSMQTYCAEME